MNKKMNKKGAIASYMVDFYAYLVFAIIMVVFFLSVTFFGSSIDEKLPSEVASADITMMLIKILQVKTFSGLTIAEIISGGNEPPDDYKTVVGGAIKKVLASKQGVADASFVVYKKELPNKNFCSIYANNFLFLPEKFGVGDYSLAGISVSEIENLVYGFVNIPLVSGDEYVSVALCVSRKWFDE